MWDYVFSPRHMMFDAACGVVILMVFRVLRRDQPPSILDRAAFVLVAMSVGRWYLGGPAARAIPGGYVGEIMQVCVQEDSEEACFLPCLSLGSFFLRGFIYLKSIRCVVWFKTAYSPAFATCASRATSGHSRRLCVADIQPLQGAARSKIFLRQSLARQFRRRFQA